MRKRDGAVLSEYLTDSRGCARSGTEADTSRHELTTAMQQLC